MAIEVERYKYIFCSKHVDSFTPISHTIIANFTQVLIKNVERQNMSPCPLFSINAMNVLIIWNV